MLNNNQKQEQKGTISYFSMEVGISHRLPTYSGGLGVLAGDTLKAYADLGLPVIGITMLNEKGYFYQRIDDEGNQIENPVQWRMNDFLVLLPNIVSINIEGREVKIRAWKHMIRGINNHNVPVLFLDTNIKENSDYDKTLTWNLYGGDRYYRLCQEMVLGIGGIRMLESLNCDSIRKYHMNEGHAALLTIELLNRTRKGDADDAENYDLNSVREKCVFTTHTPVAAGHDRFEMDLFNKLLKEYIPDFIAKKTIEQDKFNMTLLGLNMSKHINGVAKRHGEVSRSMFPNYNINSITNGIHSVTWASEPFKRLFDQYIPGWKKDSFTLRYALAIPKEEIWKAHYEAKKLLIDEINSRTNVGFDLNRFTIGYARRFTAYKRPDLLINNIERLKKIAAEVGDIQIIYAGKAHKNDQNGKNLIKKIYTTMKDINNQDCKIKIIFLENYDMRLGKLMTSGCDVWLNNPQRPYEASGTSGMKAALNGVPQISTFDGWWLEGYIKNCTGWSLGPHPHDPEYENDFSPDDEAEDLYKKLKDRILPCFYNNKSEWIEKMRHCIAMNGSFFNSHRMALQYIAGPYME